VRLKVVVTYGRRGQARGVIRRQRVSGKTAFEKGKIFPEKPAQKRSVRQPGDLCLDSIDFQLAELSATSLVAWKTHVICEKVTRCQFNTKKERYLSAPCVCVCV